MTTAVMPRRERTAPESVRVGDAMTRDYLQLGPEASLLEAFAAMVRARVHHMPVVRDDGRCLALLDLAGVVRRLPEDLVAQGSAPIRLPGSVGPLCVLDDERLTRAAATMHHAGADACCVVDAHGVMVGLLTARDVLAVVGRWANG